MVNEHDDNFDDVDNFEETDGYYDDKYESSLEEQFENEDFAQDGNWHNMEYDSSIGCWGS